MLPRDKREILPKILQSRTSAYRRAGQPAAGWWKNRIFALCKKSYFTMAIKVKAIERNVALTASSLLTLGNARMRFGIALA